LQATNEFVHSWTTTSKILEASNTRSFDKYTSIFIDELVAGTGIPRMILFGDGSNGFSGGQDEREELDVKVGEASNVDAEFTEESFEQSDSEAKVEVQLEEEKVGEVQKA